MEARLLRHSKPGSSECCHNIYQPVLVLAQRKFNVSLILCSVKAIPLLTIVSTKGEKVSAWYSNTETCTLDVVNAQRK